jgi:DNA-binding response OmpR family regulator
MLAQVADTLQDAQQKEASCALPSHLMRTPPHVLFADDEPDIVELVQVILQTAGFHVSTTDNGAGVLQLTATERFDVVLLDYWMAEVTGVELCRRIRAFDQSTPILICSGAVTQADREAALLAGAQGYVNKPFSSHDLVRALRSFVVDDN